MNPLWLQKLNEKLARISAHDSMLLLRNLGTMVSAGLSLARALGVLKRQARNIKLEKVLLALEGGITRGETLSRGLASFPAYFSPMVVAMVSSGEESGRLPEALQTLADQLEKTERLKKNVRGALMYPAVIVFAMAGVAIFLFVEVVPTLTQTLRDLNVPLPLQTKVVIWIGDAFAAYGLLIGLLAVLLGIGLVMLVRRVPRARAWRDGVFLRVPIVGPILIQTNVALTARTLASLLSSGVSLMESLSITSQVIQHTRFKRILLEALPKVEKGVTLSAIFREAQPFYPVIVSAMIEVGEETGKLGGMLGNLANYYEEEVDTATKNLTTLIEPILMLVVGVGVGFFAVAIIQPIYSLNQGI